MRYAGMPSRRACSSASSTNGAVPTPAVGMPRRSSRTTSCTLHDTHEPQSARPSTARSPWIATSLDHLVDAGREKIAFANRNVSAPGARRCCSTRSRNSAPRFFVMSSSATRRPASAPGAARAARRDALVERAHVLHRTSFVTTSARIPSHGPKTAEKRRPRRPRRRSGSAPGRVHFVHGASSGRRPCTSGVVSPRRSSPPVAGRRRRSRRARRPCSSRRPRRARRAPGRGRRARSRPSATSTGSTGSPPPSRARRRAPPASSAAVLGDRERGVAGDERHGRGAGREAALDVERLPGARLLVLREAEAELARVAERRAVEAARCARRR